jgi:CheY-like chemotaxis protein
VSERKPLLIVVDDAPGMLRLIERALQPSGYRVELYARAREALSRITIASADVALVDLRMPEIGSHSRTRAAPVQAFPHNQLLRRS